ncbi:MAG: GIY-YIG nuclease family protein [Sterolibacterium sp.]
MTNTKARQKELKLAYKLARPPMGIYAIRNMANGKAYLDKSTNLNGALNRHRLELKLGTHRNPELMSDWRRYGEAQFGFEIVEQIKDSPDPEFDYVAELGRRLAVWRATLPASSAESYL